MKAFEFQSVMNPDNTVTVPTELAGQLPSHQPLRVIFLIPDDSEEESWKQWGAEQFLKGYAEGDAIYDR